MDRSTEPLLSRCGREVDDPLVLAAAFGGEAIPTSNAGLC
jgi:hypothetical protein